MIRHGNFFVVLVLSFISQLISTIHSHLLGIVFEVNSISYFDQRIVLLIHQPLLRLLPHPQQDRRRDESSCNDHEVEEIQRVGVHVDVMVINFELPGNRRGIAVDGRDAGVSGQGFVYFLIEPLI